MDMENTSILDWYADSVVIFRAFVYNISLFERYDLYLKNVIQSENVIKQ